MGFIIPSGNAVKSIQRAVLDITTDNTTATATITSVNTAKSVVKQTGQGCQGGKSLYGGYVTLTDATTITATRLTATNVSTKIACEVIEFY